MNFFVVIFIIAILLSFWNKDKKILYIIFLFIPLTLIIFNIERSDRANYFRTYDNIIRGKFSDSAEIGMQIIMYIMARMHIRFEVFLNLFCSIAVVLLTRFFYKWSKKPTIALLLYIIYPCFLDIVQIRTFMATAIALNAMYYLKEFSSSNVIKYILLILISTSIHYSAVFYLFYLIVFLPEKWMYSILLLGLVFFMAANTKLSNYIGNVLPFLVIKLERYRVSYGVQISYYSILFLIMNYLINNFICFRYIKYLRRKTVTEDKMKLAQLILKINILSISIIVFSLFALEFMRLYRLTMILNYTIAGNLMVYNGQTKKHRLIPAGLIILVASNSLIFFYRYIYVDFMDDVVKVLFEKNYIWSKF